MRGGAQHDPGLYASYDGSLYQVRRASDNTTLNIGPLSAGGVANAAAQDSFCAGTTCVITEIYDQSGHGNNLTDAPAGGAAGGPDNLANATAAPVTVGGHKVYGVYIAAGTGYRDDSTSGIATGDAAEGEYAVFDGTHFNNGCCFDYGNAETNNDDNGAGHMEAIYFGNEKTWGFGSGNGPWIMADMENGLFSGVNTGLNSADPTIADRFTTAMIEGESEPVGHHGRQRAVRQPVHVLQRRPSLRATTRCTRRARSSSVSAATTARAPPGTFYEGVMTSGYPSAATESSVQANIVAAGYTHCDRGRGDRHHHLRRQQRQVRG